MNIHGHVLVPDGVFAMDGVFHRLSRPRDEHVEDLLGKSAVRVLRLLERELGDDDNDGRSALALLEAAALKPVARSHGEPAPKRLTAFLEGFSLHAATHIHENDRLGLERWCRYGARGAIAISRLEELPDGRVSYQMKRALPDGRTHLVMTGMELLRKLAPLVPPPRYHLLRFAGVFAPNHKLRSLVVPKPPTKVAACAPPQSATDRPAHAQSKPDSPRQTLNWAAALKRVWGIDIFECARCCTRRSEREPPAALKGSHPNAERRAPLGDAPDGQGSRNSARGDGPRAVAALGGAHVQGRKADGGPLRRRRGHAGEAQAVGAGSPTT